MISGSGLKAGTRHVLEGGGKRKPFEWTGTSWSTPGTGWGTKPAFMMALGWRYVGPEKPPSESDHG